MLAPIIPPLTHTLSQTTEELKGDSGAIVGRLWDTFSV
jgi:hypothetical protein